MTGTAFPDEQLDELVSRDPETCPAAVMLADYCQDFTGDGWIACDRPLGHGHNHVGHLTGDAYTEQGEPIDPVLVVWRQEEPPPPRPVTPHLGEGRTPDWGWDG